MESSNKMKKEKSTNHTKLTRTQLNSISNICKSIDSNLATHQNDKITKEIHYIEQTLINIIKDSKTRSKKLIFTNTIKEATIYFNIIYDNLHQIFNYHKTFNNCNKHKAQLDQIRRNCIDLLANK